MRHLRSRERGDKGRRWNINNILGGGPSCVRDFQRERSEERKERKERRSKFKREAINGVKVEERKERSKEGKKKSKKRKKKSKKGKEQEGSSGQFSQEAGKRKWIRIETPLDQVHFSISTSFLFLLLRTRQGIRTRRKERKMSNGMNE